MVALIRSRLPPDLVVILAQHLVDSGSIATLASLGSTCKTYYDLLSPYLHSTRSIGTGDFTLDTVLHAVGQPSPAEEEQVARRQGWLWSQRGRLVRARVHMHHTKHLVVDNITKAGTAEPTSYLSPIPPPLPIVEKVTINPPVLHDLSLYFSVSVVESFLRPISVSCAPSQLILRLPPDTALGSYKYLINLIDELRWPQLQQLTIFNVGAHALPSRPGLDVTVTFEPGVPIKWVPREKIPTARQIQKFEKSRLTQLVMAIPRSVRAEDGPAGLGGMRWRFVGAGNFFGGHFKEGRQFAQESCGRLSMAVQDWAERQYTAAGWSEEGVQDLLSRITFIA